MSENSQKTPTQPSMESGDFDEILSQVQQMRGFFKIGDEVIPFLGDLFRFLKDILPLMSEINNSLQLSTHKLPTASDNISQATETSEAATVEIMDKLDGISQKLVSMEKPAKGSNQEIIQDIQNDIHETITALQFQDITAQQLDHASRILKVIFEKFQELFESLNQLRSKTKLGGNVLDIMEQAGDVELREQSKQDFDDKTKDNIHKNIESQEDIDRLFSG